jgi:membrane peptidoglycan carboxypeptidase
VIQSPYYWSPFAAPARCRERRNIVLGAMAEEEFISAEAAARTAAEPIEVVQRALDAQAPYFVDVVGQSLGEQFPDCRRVPTASRCSPRSIRTCSAWRRTRSAKG